MKNKKLKLFFSDLKKYLIINRNYSKYSYIIVARTDAISKILSSDLAKSLSVKKFKSS